MAGFLCRIDYTGRLRSDDQPFRVHLVLGKILDINGAKMADTHVQGYESLVYVFENHPVHQLAAEMQTGSRSADRPFLTREDCLIVFLVLFRDMRLNPLRDRRFTKREQGILELLVASVI